MTSFDSLFVPSDDPIRQPCISFRLLDVLSFQLLVQAPVVELGRSRDVEDLIYVCLAGNAVQNQSRGVCLRRLVKLQAPASEGVPASMSALMIRSSDQDDSHLQAVVSEPSHRGIHTFQAETPQHLGFLSHLCNQIEMHLVLRSSTAILYTSVR